MSPLLLRYRPAGEPADRLLDEIAGFVRYAVVERGLGVLLVPHVIPHDGTVKDNDAAFMAQLLPRLNDLGNRVQLMDERLNAAQIKHVIAQCRFFIGSRTHSTIAALSSGVPTISIAYSVKAKGINHDLFGHNRYVLDTLEVSRESLTERLTRLWNEESDLRSLLVSTTEAMGKRAREALRRLAQEVFA